MFKFAAVAKFMGMVLGCLRMVSHGSVGCFGAGECTCQKNGVCECRWSDQFSDFVDSSAWYLMRRRLQWEASADWQGDPAHKLDPSKLQPVISLLLQLALPALHHKSGSLRAASLELLSNAMYVEPDIVLPVVVQRFHEALEASDSVHQLSGSIRLLCCAFSPPSKFPASGPLCLCYLASCTYSCCWCLCFILPFVLCLFVQRCDT